VCWLFGLRKFLYVTNTFLLYITTRVSSIRSLCLYVTNSLLYITTRVSSIRSLCRMSLLLYIFLSFPLICNGYDIISITGNLSSSPSSFIIPNAFSTITVWDPQSLLSTPPVNLSVSYPYLTHVELFTATGGCYEGYSGCTTTRDLFNDPSIGMASGVNASRLFLPISNILKAGLIPHIITGNVPIILSGDNAFIGAFGFNSAPPSNFSEYSLYLEKVTSQLVDEFSIDIVKRWRWGVYTEFNNQDWLKGTSKTFEDLFDYSVCGIERGLGGPANVNVGVHACQQCGGSLDWNPISFLIHAAHGISACTGGPVHLNWTGNSFYEHSPGDPGDLSLFVPQGLIVLEEAQSLGLPTNRFGIDEGRLLWGPEGPQFALTTRALGDSYQASWDALLFKLLTQTGVESYYSRWGITSGDGLFSQGNGVIDNAASNLAQLAFKMNGTLFVPTINTSQTNQGLSIVDAIVGASQEDHILRILVFHHYSLLNISETIAPLTAFVSICGISTSVPSGPIDTATVTRIDDKNANFWPTWRQDALAANISRANGDYNSGWSEYSDNMPLASTRAINLLAENTLRYKSLALLVEEKLTGVSISSNSHCLSFEIDMVPHSVALVEVNGVVY
jgi:hypothetical protein